MAKITKHATLTLEDAKAIFVEAAKKIGPTWECVHTRSVVVEFRGFCATYDDYNDVVTWEVEVNTGTPEEPVWTPACFQEHYPVVDFAW